MRTPGLLLLCFVDTIFENIATRFRCGDYGEIRHKSLLQIVCWVYERILQSPPVFGEDMKKCLDLNFWPILCDSIVFLIYISQGSVGYTAKAVFTLLTTLDDVL